MPRYPNSMAVDEQAAPRSSLAPPSSGTTSSTGRSIATEGTAVVGLRAATAQTPRAGGATERQSGGELLIYVTSLGPARPQPTGQSDRDPAALVVPGTGPNRALGPLNRYQSAESGCKLGDTPDPCRLSRCGGDHDNAGSCVAITCFPCRAIAWSFDIGCILVWVVRSAGVALFGLCASSPPAGRRVPICNM